MPLALAQGMVERPLGSLLTGIVTARLLVACGGMSVAEQGTDEGTGGTGGSGTGGTSAGGSGGSGTGGAGGTGTVGGTGGVGGAGAVGGAGGVGGAGAVGGAGVGGAGALGGTGAGGGIGAFGGSGGLGGTGGMPSGTPVFAMGCGGDSSTAQLAHGLELPDPVDYLAVYSMGVPAPSDSIGTLCDGAADRAACETEYAEAVAGYTLPLQPRPLSIQWLPSVAGYVAYTRSDDVRMVVDNAALVPLLGEIDTPNEALLSFHVNGYSGTCQQLYEDDDGYYMIAPAVPMGCARGYATYLLRVTTEGAVSVTGIGAEVGGCVGRRPRGLAPSATGSDGTATGRYYARIAELEAAAVIAFDFMVEELRAVGAPEALIRRAEDAGRDEVRHARVMAALAGRYGAGVEKPHVAPRRAMTLLEMALENVAEGCVRETWGALSARYQSQAAESFADRLVWGEVADEEARHAELSWDLHGWFMSRLSLAEQREVEEEQRRAWDELVLELDAEPDRDVQRIAGVPSRSTALELARDLAVQLKGWSRAPHAA
jgi:hypothetical protein